jgi:hypothetical protein
MDGFSIVIHTRADQWNSKIGDTFSLHEQEVPNFLLGLFDAHRKERRIDKLFSGTNSPAQGAKKLLQSRP